MYSIFHIHPPGGLLTKKSTLLCSDQKVQEHPNINSQVQYQDYLHQARILSHQLPCQQQQAKGPHPKAHRGT